MDALRRAPTRFVITSNAGVSLEQFLRDVNLSKELLEVIAVQFTTEELGSTRFVVTCPDYWVGDEVLLHVPLLDQKYDVYLDKTMTYSLESIAGGSGDGVATPTLESTSRRSTISTPSNGSDFSPWKTVNPLESPLRDVQQSPLSNPEHYNTPHSFYGLSEADPPTASPSTEFQRSNGVRKQGEHSDQGSYFFAVAEGDEEYVGEWPWSIENGNTKEGNVKGDAETCPSDASRKQGTQSSSPRYSNEEEEESSALDQETEESDMDLDTTEEDDVEVRTQEPAAERYEADRSEADSDRDLHQIQQQPPSPRVVTSPSNQDARYMQASVAVAASPPRTHITESEPAADAGASSTTEASSNALPQPENDSVSNDLPDEEAADIDDLIQAMSAMAATLSDDDGTANPELAPNGQREEDSPNTSAESAALLGAIRGEFDAILGVGPPAMMGPDVHESVQDGAGLTGCEGVGCHTTSLRYFV